MRRCSVIGAAYPCLAIRATFCEPAPRPHPLALSGVETPVNLAFVEATYALGSPMEFSKRVLIVDDEPNVVGVLLEFFARFEHGHTYDVVPAYSAAEALDTLLRGAFDLTLLDLIIPGIGGRWRQGLDLLKRIRDLGVKAPVIMMSGGGGRPEGRGAERGGRRVSAQAVQSTRPRPFRCSRSWPCDWRLRARADRSEASVIEKRP